MIDGYKNLPLILYNVVFAGLQYIFGQFETPWSQFSLYYITSFDLPTWFLLSLFWTSCIYHFLDLIILKKTALLIACCVIGLLYAYLSSYIPELPLYIGQALFSLPFFAIAAYIGLNKYDTLIKGTINLLMRFLINPLVGL